MIKYAKLHQKKFRDLEVLTLIEGSRLIEEAFKLGLVVDAYSLDTSFQQVSPHVMKKLAGSHIPEAMAIIKKPISKLLKGHFLVCENIQDPGNLGTLMRSAEAFKFLNVITIDGVDPYSPKVIKSSEGSFLKINIMPLTLKEALKITQTTFKVMTHPHQGTQEKRERPLSIWLGNEGQGLSKEALSHADMLYQINTQGVESLNVAVAGSIAMFDFQNQRLSKEMN
jgi:TrmH family RNA methyltransferase